MRIGLRAKHGPNPEPGSRSPAIGYTGQSMRARSSMQRAWLVWHMALGIVGCAAAPLPAVPALGHTGGRIVYGARAEPKTLNPIFANDAPSREVISALTADLIHINRATLQTELALAKSCKISPDGLRYDLELREGLRFSDGRPFDADDVIFTFQVVLDPAVDSPQRSLWVLDGKPIAVRKLDRYRVRFDLPRPDAVGLRIFDGVPMLPRHLLEPYYRQGKLASAWTLQTPAAEIAGLGPFRLRSYTPGQRMVLERNPYYWKTDAAGNRLPYLSELVFDFAGDADLQFLRFRGGESDLIGRVAAKDYAALQRDSGAGRFALRDAGPGFEYNFLLFNLTSAADPHAPWQRVRFRQAISAAVDRDAIVKLVYKGYATALASPVPAGNRLWIDRTLAPQPRAVERARALLQADGFQWSRGGILQDPEGRKVEFTILVSASNPERAQAATLIQADLQALGIEAQVAPLEFRSLVDRVLRTHQYDACIFALSSSDADPNADLQVWLSSASMHLWNPEQKSPATPWEAEIDALMRRQMTVTAFAERKRLFDRVQEIAAGQLPVIPLVSPHVLAAARQDIGNFDPAPIEPFALSNVEYLYRETAATERR